MSGFIRRCAAAAVLGAGAMSAWAQNVPPPPATTAHVSADFSRVDEAAAEYLRKSGLPGAGVMVIEGGRVVYEKYYGSYDETTVVSLASASKWLSGAALVALQEKGKLDLDDKVSTYVKQFGADPAQPRAGITIRQCFNHTSGLPGEFLAAEAPRLTLEEAVAKIAGVELVSAPGSEFRYGGVSMRVAGRCAEVAAEKEWRDIFEETIAGPLKMDSTTYGRFEAMKNPNLAGGGRSTLRDYGRFMRMLLGGGELDGARVLSPEGVKELLRDETGGVPIARASVGRRAGNGKSSYGVGCWVDQKDAQGETITASSPGAFGFLPMINTEKGIAAVWMIEDRKRVRNTLKDLPDMAQVLKDALKVGMPSTAEPQAK
ncbi:MAG: serine hydrolase domain-containing protein [Phycisphaerales bacterium]